MRRCVASGSSYARAFVHALPAAFSRCPSIVAHSIPRMQEHPRMHGTLCACGLRLAAALRRGRTPALHETSSRISKLNVIQAEVANMKPETKEKLCT
ncbi:hypothetical protein B0H17DRAFT_1338806 [Mycena rosella]|uniref:Uncharacterized protein n=1 Tax=Mycena rosella TaxID=1033263 RepID=A0AAD7CH72_MYCRO|nr:hypothetical protein B0H17DRAFT_1338806 [Mycena rosella]